MLIPIIPLFKLKIKTLVVNFAKSLVLFRCGKVNQNYMKHKELYLSLLLILFFGIDAFYWYGYTNLIDIFVDNAIVWFLISLVGFLLLYFFNKESFKKKVLFNIIISLGVLLNLYFVFSWFIIKDFGF